MSADRYPREYLLSELKRVARLIGKMPAMPEFDRESNVSSQTLVKRFKGWKNALASAGFDPDKAKYSYQENELIEELKRVATALGRTPSVEEFKKMSTISPTAVTRRFGKTWAEACEFVGLPAYVRKPNSNLPKLWAKRKGYRKLRISADELHYSYEVEGLSASAIAKRHEVSKDVVLRALREQGIEIKRLHYTMPRSTSIEEMLYNELERRGITFTKQQIVDGLYVTDAIIPGARVIIECDGEYWHSLEGRADKDKKRDKYLTSRGYIVVRFPEAAIRADVAKCVQKIVDILIDRYSRK
jgi:very-short-patch-repair endonuclease